MPEISSSRPLPPASSGRPVNPTAELALKLLQPLDGLLAAGESAKAEVLSVKANAQNFQMLLQLTLDNGRKATLQTESSKPLPPGSPLVVTALAENKLGVALRAGNAAQAMASLDLELLPVGSLIQGKVVASQQLAEQRSQQVVYRVVVNLLNTALAGQQLSIDSTQPLVPGSLLTARVEGAQQLAFLPLSGRLDQLELGQQLTSQHSRQASLEGVLKALQGLLSGPAAGSLPEQLRGSMEKLLAGLPEMAQLGDPKALAKALESSGVFLEARLLGGQASATGQDLKANLLKLIAQLLPNLPGGTPLQGANVAINLAQALPALLRGALGGLGQPNGRQQALSFPLPSRVLQNMDGEADLEMLLRLAAAAVSRLQTHQLSSLAQSQVGPEGNLLTTWQLELPMRNQQELVPLQLKLQRDDPPRKGKEPPREPAWRLELAFDLQPLGPLQVQAQLAQGQISSQLWAERQQTARLIDAELGHLRERLGAAGFNVRELSCRQGTPPQGPRTTLEQRWIDETA